MENLQRAGSPTSAAAEDCIRELGELKEKHVQQKIQDESYFAEERNTIQQQIQALQRRLDGLDDEHRALASEREQTYWPSVQRKALELTKLLSAKTRAPSPPAQTAIQGQGVRELRSRVVGDRPSGDDPNPEPEPEPEPESNHRDEETPSPGPERDRSRLQGQRNEESAVEHTSPTVHVCLPGC